MHATAPDIIGFVGVGFIVGSYFLSQIGRMKVDRPLYPALNGLGAALILISLVFAFNAASFAIESFWLAISAIGLVRAVAGRSKPRE